MRRFIFVLFTHTVCAMKKKIFIATLILTLCLMILPACEVSMDDSIKSLTHPYAGEYECVEAKFGEKDLLESYEYIKITFLDAEKFEISYKPKDGQKRSFESNYTVDEGTRELTGELGIFGYKFREKIKIEHGEFTITKTMMNKPLIIKFKMK